jgi:tetratricopeptide (TPR) repeat protein
MAMGYAVCALAQSSCQQWVGKLVSLQGVAEVRYAGESEWHAVELEATFCFGDTIRIKEDGRAAVQLQNDALLRLDQKTTLTFSDLENERTYIIDLIKGAVHFFSRGSRSLKVVTPYVNAAVEGTEFEVRVTDDEAQVTLMAGQVLLENEQGEVLLAKGQVGTARAGMAPTARVTVSPRDAVEWALYYPRVVQVPSEGEAALSDARRLILTAEEKLTRGQVDLAEEDIDAALFLEPDSGEAMALKAVIAVVNNHKEEAFSLAREAVDASPGAAASHLALSYALQATFDLDGALEALEAAVDLEPENALAWARLSELRLSLEDEKGALEAARRATAINPELSLTQSVLGYAYLAQVKLDASVIAFETAVQLDSTAPLAQLGLGLAKIRKGDLTEGRRLIEVAAGLDPANSVIRSYLGKAYFEEKRDKFSADQFAIAKELDPLDPTPWLYDAIRMQSINQPVEALYALYQSIQLNDNRAVYRSRFQLDQDLAVRGTSLARVYNDLGFQQLGLLEGRKSLSLDPGNYSAHLLLADSYSALPRHEIARVSELLQTQLLQPINTTSITAGLSKTSLTFLESSLLGSTPFSTDFSMMTQNEMRLLATGILGSNSLIGGDVVVNGVQNQFSFSAGYNYFSTDGVRENNDQMEELTNVFAQLQLTSNTSLQAEYRFEDDEVGDIDRLFNPNDYWPDLRKNQTVSTYRLGVHHQFGLGADFLFSGIYEELDQKWTNRYVTELMGWLMETGFEIEGDSKNYLVEAQQHFRMGNVTAIAGAGYYDGDISTEQSCIYSVFSQPTKVVLNEKYKQENIYLYSNASIVGDITLIVGGDYSGYNDGKISGNQINPKMGAIWQITGTTSMRIAGFRTLMRMLPSTEQTIEPTQVAGFNQFYDDPSGTDTWHYGIGFDHTFSSSVYGGVEYFLRDIHFPYTTDIDSRMKVSYWDEKTAHAYLYWAPMDRISTSIELYHEGFDRDTTYGNPSAFSTMDVYRVPLSFRYFYSDGLVAAMKGTYLHEKGDFGDAETGFTPGFDCFWVVDALLGWRLPKRLGMLTLEVRNLFDEEFFFQDSDPYNPLTVSERVVLGRVTFSY